MPQVNELSWIYLSIFYILLSLFFFTKFTNISILSLKIVSPMKNIKTFSFLY